ncbi:NUDIX hydrolase [Candidatus Micrarchaeota archaeon]|nr:NUDIX hydrolase [Candidatus Micrarchaeota archaeon]
MEERQQPELNAYLIIFFNERVLILQRTNAIWEFPGGGVDFGEHPEKAAFREAKEETGLTIHNLKFLGISSAVYEKQGKQKHSIYLVYKGDADKEDFKLGPEHIQGRWVSLHELDFMKLGYNARDAAEMLKI